MPLNVPKQAQENRSEIRQIKIEIPEIDLTKDQENKPITYNIHTSHMQCMGWLFTF